MTSQEEASLLLQQWQALRSLPPDERIEILMADFFAPPPESDLLYELTLQCVSAEMEEVS